VVDSILQQIEMVDGRFLEKASSNENHWVIVPAKVARLKVSHALRDKLPLNTIQKAKIKLVELFKHHSRRTDVSDDGIYNIINAMVFRTCLDNCDQACGNHVEMELSKVICNFLERFINLGKESNEKSVVGSNGIEISCIHQVQDSEPENLCTLVNRIMMLASIASEAKISDIKYQVRYTLVEDNFKGIFHDDVSETEYFLVDDLPQNFTEDDCEQLMASLDHEC
jgi:hypothetical protein